MKLYTGRIKKYKRFLNRRPIFNALVFASKLKPGDLVTCCGCYNKIVNKISPQIYSCRQQRYVLDFNIQFITGDVCDAVSCCTFPRLSVMEIKSIFLNEYQNSTKKIYEHWRREGAWESSFGYRLAHGEEVFDERGCLLEEKHA